MNAMTQVEDMAIAFTIAGQYLAHFFVFIIHEGDLLQVFFRNHGKRIAEVDGPVHSLGIYAGQYLKPLESTVCSQLFWRMKQVLPLFCAGIFHLIGYV